VHASRRPAMRAPNRKKLARQERTERLVWRGALLLAGALAIGALGGWTRRAPAGAERARGDPRRRARPVGSLRDEVAAARGETEVVRLQLDRANTVMEYSSKYQIPADLSAAIY